MISNMKLAGYGQTRTSSCHRKAINFIILVGLLGVFCQGHQLAVSRAATHEFQSQQQCINSSLSTNQTTIPMMNCFNNIYAINLGIGTPPQFFDFQFDTGSNVLWVPSSPSLSNSTAVFVPSDSSTCNISKVPYRIEYADGSLVGGDIGSDMLQMEDTSIDGKNSILFVMEQKNMEFPDDIVGIVGMGYTDLNNFLDNAYRDGQIDTNVFILSLKEVDDGSQFTNSTTSSFLYYNQLPEEIVDGTLYSDVAGDGYWELPLVGVYGGNQDFTSSAESVAVIDSGTSLFYLNPALAQALIDEYMNTKWCKLGTSGGFYCECFAINNSMPNLYFMFPGVQVTIPPSAYISHIGNGVCFVMFLTLSTTSDQVLLGDTLFHQYAVTFDKNQGRVGFYGDTKEIHIFGTSVSGFGTSQYVMMGFSYLFLLIAIFLLYHLRIKGRLEGKALKKLEGDNITAKYGEMNDKKMKLASNTIDPYSSVPRGKVLYMGETEYGYQQRMNQNL